VVATADHNTPTTGWERGYRRHRRPDLAQLQVETLDANMRAYGAKAYFPFLDKRQGIVHVIGPEQGATLPGMTVVCGDSHTSTHGAFGCAGARHRHSARSSTCWPRSAWCRRR
jgi:3-isopropylmalate/(R)-2-methylmalate dehydratase large subunit